MTAPLRLAIEPGGRSIAAAQAAVAGFIEGAGLPRRAARRAELVVEEVALNALGHGGAAEVRLEATVGAEGCLLRFEDEGAAFDPTGADHAPGAGAMEGQGGLGLVLVRRTAARLAYVRLAAGVNRLDVVIGVA